MNTLHFWLGFFAGITALTVWILLWLPSMRAKNQKEVNEKVLNYNERTLAALRERNEIDRGIADSLRSIAERRQRESD